MKPRRQSADPLERYDTPTWVTRALLAHCPAIYSLNVMEPMAGAGAVSRPLADEGDCVVTGYDIAPRVEGVHQADTLTPLFWQRELQPWCAVVTNPPFAGAAELLRLALGAGVGIVSLLVRLTWLESVNDRADLPDPHTLIIVPRPKFIESPEARAVREAAGKPWGGDNCTVAWATWVQGWGTREIARAIYRVNRTEKAQLEREPWKAVA